MFICLGSAKGSNSDMRGSMLFPSERANMPYTAQKSVYLLWPGLGSGEKKFIRNTKHVRERNTGKTFAFTIENPHLWRLCGV